MINKRIITLALTLALVTGSAIGVTPITGYAAEDEKITETAEKTDGSESETQEDHKYTYTELKTGSSADFYDGTDISDYEVVEIGSVEDLEALAANCILDEWSLNKNVKLTADIDLQGRSVTIPTFGGVFDGNGHAIKGLVYENETSIMGVALTNISANPVVEPNTPIQKAEIALPGSAPAASIRITIRNSVIVVIIATVKKRFIIMRIPPAFHLPSFCQSGLYQDSRFSGFP